MNIKVFLVLYLLLLLRPFWLGKLKFNLFEIEFLFYKINLRYLRKFQINVIINLRCLRKFQINVIINDMIAQIQIRY